MRRLVLVFACSMLLVAAGFGVARLARGQEPAAPGAPAVLSRETQGDNVREITAPALDGAPPKPSIGFIDSPSATCYQPDPAADACYINWYYLSVSASPSYMISMTVAINAIGMVARTGGFFQTSMYVPYAMFPEGFKVQCGALGAGGDPAFGAAYAWTIRARDSAGTSSANYGTTYCPAYRR